MLGRIVIQPTAKLSHGRLGEDHQAGIVLGRERRVFTYDLDVAGNVFGTEHLGESYLHTFNSRGCS